MKRSTTSCSPLRRIATALLTGACITGIVAITSCTTISGTGTTAVYQTKDGAAVVDTFEATATVISINTETRKLGLRFPDGRRTTVKCGPEVVNFGQIRINDEVNLTMVEEYAVYLGHGASPSAGAAGAVVLAPVGAKPGGINIETVQITARISAIDPAKRKVTLELPDGSMKTVKVSKQVDLSRVSVGDNVTVEHTEAIAVTVGTP